MIMMIMLIDVAIVILVMTVYLAHLTNVVNRATLRQEGGRMRRKPVVRETVSLYEAKTQLSRLVEQAAAGQEIIIAKSGRPRARLVALADTPPTRVSGAGKGQWRTGADFDAPLANDILDRFEGGR